MDDFKAESTMDDSHHEPASYAPATEADVPGYIEECFPCPEEEEPDDPNGDDKPDDPNENEKPNGGDDTTSTYEKDGNGKYKTSEYVLNSFNSVRLSTYVVIEPITTNDTPVITPIDEDDTEEYDDDEYDDDQEQEQPSPKKKKNSNNDDDSGVKFPQQQQ